MNRAVVARWIETFSTALEEDDGDDDDDDDDDDDGGNDVVAMFWCQGVGEEVRTIVSLQHRQRTSPPSRPLHKTSEVSRKKGAVA